MCPWPTPRSSAQWATLFILSVAGACQKPAEVPIPNPAPASGPGSNQSGEGATITKLSPDAREMRARFAEMGHKARLVLILSPT